MKQFGVILAAMLFAISSAFADGTKQFMPYEKTVDGVMQGKGETYLTIAAQEGGNAASRPFARYNGKKSPYESCDEPHRLHIHIEKPEDETICFGFGSKIGGSGEKYLHFRVKDPDGNIVKVMKLSGGTLTEVTASGGVKNDIAVPTATGAGYIGSYAEAYYGPKKNKAGETINSNGYEPYFVIPTKKGDYWIEFDNGDDIGTEGSNRNALSLKYFDVSVIDNTTDKALSGRIWSRAWGLDTNGSDHPTYTTFYPMSTDKYVSKVYLAGFKPYKFVVACNSFGSQYTKNCEEDRKSLFQPQVTQPDKDPYDEMPEYQIFLTQPDPKLWGEAQIPNVPDRLTFAGDAMTCEDLIFVVQLLYNENATLELYLDTDGDNTPDKVIASLLQATVLRDRGFHYPWKAWTELKEPGQGKYFYTPAADGCARLYTLSLFNQSFIYDCPEYTILTGGGESRTATVDTANPGDSLRIAYTTGFDTETGKYDFDNSKYRLQYPIGSEQNPILISSAEDLENLLSATNSSEERSYHVKYENYYHYYYHDGETIKHQWGNFETDIPNTNGFEGVYFYIIAPSESIVLEDHPEKDWTWDGIGTAEHPFKGHIRAGKYAPDPTVNKNTPTPDDDPEPLPAGSHQNTIILNGTSNGLFGYCEGATIENIHVKGSIVDANGTGGDFYNGIGGICNYAKNTIFSHCSNSCKIEMSDDCEYGYVGGIVGFGDECEIDSCSNYGIIISKHEECSAGGIIGFAIDGTINFCYNVANVSDLLSAGGIAGTIQRGEIRNCKNEGYIRGTGTGAGWFTSKAGGIVGTNYSTTEVIACLNVGTITAENCAGICYGDGDQIVMYCMNTGNLYGSIDDYAITNNSYTTRSDLVRKSISTNPAIYFNGLAQDSDTIRTDAEREAFYATLVAPEDSPFNLDEDGLYMSNVECCGRGFRQEDAGRLLKSNTTFYIKWDGKNSDGECVTGDVTVSYQKNSGVTHFPFFDPENNIMDRGLVVYRISPIPDSIKDTKHGYQELPLNYYQTSATDPTEHGIELKLYWDDTNIEYDHNSSGTKEHKACTDSEQRTFLFGETRTIPGSRTETPVFYFQSTGEASKNCSGGYKSTCSGYNYKDSRGRSKTTKICCETLKAGGKSNYPGFDVVTTASYTNCFGISNLGSSDIWNKEPNASKADRLGGYYGSVAGGHMFPISNFGDKNTMNTWWNGVEVKQLVPLKLYENSPAILMPIELTMWTATNLEESVLLEWTTASEENNDYFAVERSIDGVTWKVLGNVGGAGTTSTTHYYSFEDTKPVSGISYYRLKQVDFNGEYTYSSVKCINRPANADKMYKAYVNQDIDAFIVQGEEIAACNIEVYNNLGIKMTNLSFNPISTDKVVINVGQLPIGTYFIKICNGSKSVVKSW